MAGAARTVVLAVMACSFSCLAYVMPVVAPAPRASRAAAARMEQGVEKATPMMPNQHTWFPGSDDMAMSAKKWYVVDAKGLRLGRMSSEIAKILIGKHKPEFTPGTDIGDCVIVVNADKVIVTGKKSSQKMYKRHSGRPGGMKMESFDELQQRIPERYKLTDAHSHYSPPAPARSLAHQLASAALKAVGRGPTREPPSPPRPSNRGPAQRTCRIVEKAIKGMLPHTSAGRELFRHLKVYQGAKHPHDAQAPEELTFIGLTSTPDGRVLDLTDPDAMVICA